MENVLAGDAFMPDNETPNDTGSYVLNTLEKGQYLDDAKKNINIPISSSETEELENNLMIGDKVVTIDPACCQPWKYHNRDKIWFAKDNCKDLIASISKVGQQVPVMLRKSSLGSDYEYDIIYGARRWFACKELGKKLYARITELDDRECMILMHVENADSKDISDFERAYSFRMQYKAGFFSSQNDFAEAMNISKSMVTKLFTAAELSDNPWFNEFVTNKLEVPLIKAYKISSALRNSFTREFVEKEISKLRDNLLESKNTITTRKFIIFLENIIFRDTSEMKTKLTNLSDINSNFKVKIDTKKQLTIRIKPLLNKKLAGELLDMVMETYYKQ